MTRDDLFVRYIRIASKDSGNDITFQANFCTENFNWIYFHKHSSTRIRFKTVKLSIYSSKHCLGISE